MNLEYSVPFETEPKYCIFKYFVDYEDYSISSKGLLPTVVDRTVIWIKFAHSHPFQFTDSLDIDVQYCHLLLCHGQFILIQEPSILCSYVILFYTALDFTFTTRHIYRWMSFLLWPSLFILSGTISNFPLLFSSRILGSFQHWELVSVVISFCIFTLFMWFSWQEHWSELLFPLHTFCLKSSLLLAHLGWPCIERLIASLSYTSPFTTTRLWSMKEIHIPHLNPVIYW